MLTIHNIERSVGSGAARTFILRQISLEIREGEFVTIMGPSGAGKSTLLSQLSGGQQQLVGVARAVIAEPKLILADEPTGNLHSRQAREIMELFKRLNDEGTTIVQVTHSEENAAYGDRIIELKDGWIEGAPVARQAKAKAEA